MNSLNAEVDCLLREGQFAAVVERWFELGLGMAPDLVLAPGVESELVDQAPGGGGFSTQAYSAAAWEDRIRGLEKRPMGLSLSLKVPQGVEGAGRRFGVSMNDEFNATPGWVSLTVDETVADVGEFVPGTGARWREFLVAALDSVPVAFGRVATDGNVGLQTSLDAALNRNVIVSMLQSSQYLRGYSWITVCPAALAERLGGAVALVASGAWARVVELSSGDMVLQATEEPAEFDDAALRRVWAALASVLPPGTPEKVLGSEYYQVILEDAATVE
ncbi:hypothetical protein [Kribbella antibiotica]|uniref:hypothetical protein n=1 Tax=Kribbella antibiotica TaxID=190195 RepID=UPI0010439A90|nr:hypothetical protein [Kribbella antibiotica]